MKKFTCEEYTDETIQDFIEEAEFHLRQTLECLEAFYTMVGDRSDYSETRKGDLRRWVNHDMLGKLKLSRTRIQKTIEAFQNATV